MKKYFKFSVLMVLFMTLCLGFNSCSGGSSRNISSIDEAKNFINGKTFIATPTGERKMWYKVSFTGNSFTLWTSTPTAGSWGSPRFTGSYKIESQRYSNTGKEFFYTVLTDANDSYHSNIYCTKFIITDLSFVNCNAYNSDDRAMAKEGDRNPWN